ncbi:sensor histidine kinase [Catellatospora sichuanensis]|uniref:sensor histidine kinase n=1 Tax=Catellatospora sichuanensis TaxID=1969805 RepID=UPI001FE689FE|nr:HAMP domain-containing sensor histidine kinase [Catellatospora sichuanensis]
MIRPPWRRWTLRTRMVVAVVALAGVALLITDFVAATTLRHYLAQQLDEDVRRLNGGLERFGGPGPGGFGNRPQPSSEATPKPPGRDTGQPGPAVPSPVGTVQPSPTATSQASPSPAVVGDNCNGPQTTNGGWRLPPAQGDTIVIAYDAQGQISWCLSGGSTVAQGPQLTFDQIKSHAQAGGPRERATLFTATSASGQDFRVAASQAPGGYRVAAISLDRVESTANLVLLLGLGVGALVLLGLGFAAYSVVRIGLRPLTNMEHAAAQIAGGDLTARVPDPDPHTEPGRLGLALNTMLSRIEAAVTARAASEQRLRQFLADASHELRTPLTSIRGFAELYRRGGAPPGPELDETMSRIEQEAGRMGLLVEDLLLLAALDEERPLQQSRVDLLAVAADTVRDAHVRSPGRTVELAGFEPVGVQGDEHRLRQVVTNLVANALQHTPRDARVTLRVSHRGGESLDEPFELPVARDSGPVVASVGAELDPDLPVAVVEVEDTGPGVPPEHAARIFERLYRADPHRARSHGGAGLGLAIASAIVKAHGGRIELATSPGVGSTFRVLLPLAA